jgi:hypothetical protein
MNISNFNYALMISTLLISSSVNAQSWIKLGSSNNREVLYDSDSLNGGDEDKNIIVLFKNKIDNPSDAVQSEIFYYSLNCTDRSYIIKSRKRFKDINAKDFLDETIGKNQKRVTDIKPNTFPLKYFDAACKTKELENAGAQSNRTNDLNKASLNSAPTSSNNNPSTSNSPPATQKNSFHYFSRINPDKNLQDAFLSLTKEQKELKNSVAWNFALANNVFVKLTKSNSNDWSKQASVLAPVLPTMKQGVERYLKSFDEMATALGVSRAAVMIFFDIAIDEAGYANFRRFAIGDDGQRNQNISGAANQYIFVYGASTRQERDYYGRDMNAYYRERPPPNLYTTTVTEDLRQIDAIQQWVVASALRIESQLAAQENNRIKAEKDATTRREADEKKFAEERAKRQEEERKRQEFLNSPEGKKQIAKEQEEERQRQKQFAQAFPFYAVVTCGENFPVHACFSGRVNTELELRNGNEYKMYTLVDIMQIPQNQNGISFNLQNKFNIKMQNSNDTLILNLKIYSRANNSIVFEKSAARFGVIRASN